MTLVPHQLPDVYGGPAACLARAALGNDVSIADLTIGEPPEEIEDDENVELGDEESEAEDSGPEEGEIEVRFMVNDVPPARRVIKRWAATAGYRRVWFRDEVADLETPDYLDGEFVTACPSCRLEIRDSGPNLMGFVRKAGHFPMNCFVCGTFVPQWEPVRLEECDEHSASSRRTARNEDSTLRVVGA